MGPSMSKSRTELASVWPPIADVAREVGSRAMIDATPIIGLRISLERTVDTPCACGETAVDIGQGAAPHAASLHCAELRSSPRLVAAGDRRISP